jgi:hypothetical protein
MITDDGGVTLIDPQIRDTVGQINTALTLVMKLTHGFNQVDATGSGDKTLTQAESRARIVRIIGAPTAARNLYVALTQTARVVIFQNTTGFQMTIRAVGQSSGGVAVPAGQNREVFQTDGVMKQTNT